MKLFRLLFSGVLAATAALASGGAQAATLFTLAGPTAEMASPDSLSETFTSAGGAGSTSFRIDGYGSLDGDTYWHDVFTLSLNGVAILSGTWDLGGGSPGANLVYFAPDGATTNAVSNSYFQGGYADIFVPLTLSAGSNTLTFAYDSPPYAGPEGIANEGWGVENVSVQGLAAGAVPEPATWIVMILGLGATGAALRHRRQLALATAV
jgi:hypothetical protein